MSGPTRPPGGGAPRQPWSPEQAPKGVTCPACGLANAAGVRTCRNCGLPIASADDPVRGVAPGRVEMPSAKRSGLSATIGLVLVIGLLMVGGTLAVSGGGILSTGGRLGVDAPSPSPTIAPVAESGTKTVTTPDGETGTEGTDTEADTGNSTKVGTSFGYTCDEAAIADLSKRKWTLKPFVAGPREGYDRITFEAERVGNKKAKNGLVVAMAWHDDPREIQRQLGAPSRVQGDSAISLTFQGPADINVDQVLDQLFLERENIEQVRNIQMFAGQGNDVHVIVGLRGDSCAKMSVKGKGWEKGSNFKKVEVYLDIERFDQ